eukprot:TRINITY_DN3820_c0_g2_i1.p1 TRINITY_DN3820_c0_g2~~TRINITY_DN3820_c0_g2_i1.p1  ORF type:complete len:398 (-),score=94.82 TRINITY_DN3820_c0_g2_i1:393-1586(-)
MDFGGLDPYLSFDTLLPDPYSDFSPSHSNSDTDTLSPSLSPSPGDFSYDVGNQDFDITNWSFDSFPKSEETTESGTSWGTQSLIPANVNLLQQPQTAFVPPVPTVDPTTVAPKLSLPTKKPRAKRRKIENEKEVSTTPPDSPPAIPLSLAGEGRLALTRDELLHFTSAQYEALISQVRSVRDLTAAEKRDIKNQRRLIKNRESAHASRQRKKDYVQELEKKLADMAQENDRIMKALTAVQNENVILRSENEFYKSRMQAGTLIPPVVQRGANFFAQQQIPPKIQLLQQQHQMNVKPSHNKAGGLVLMVLLFSFGIMFGNLGFPGSNNQFPLESTSVPDVLPRVYQREEFKQVSNTQFNVLPEEATQSSVLRERLRKKVALEEVPMVEEMDLSVSGGK